jgi:hypothetical protein
VPRGPNHRHPPLPLSTTTTPALPMPREEEGEEGKEAAGAYVSGSTCLNTRCRLPPDPVLAPAVANLVVTAAAEAWRAAENPECLELGCSEALLESPEEEDDGDEEMEA